MAAGDSTEGCCGAIRDSTLGTAKDTATFPCLGSGYGGLARVVFSEKRNPGQTGLGWESPDRWNGRSDFGVSRASAAPALRSGVWAGTSGPTSLWRTS